jgi:hypothetical protein
LLETPDGEWAREGSFRPVGFFMDDRTVCGGTIGLEPRERAPCFMIFLPASRLGPRDDLTS